MQNVDVLLGLQWGDEGKGKVVDFLTPNYDIVARFQGGANAGHTIEFDGNKFVLHIIPSGIFHDGVRNFIGNGVVIEPVILEKEIENLKSLGINPSNNLFISQKAHLIMPTHRLLDAAHEYAKGKGKIGSTLKGIGPTYTDKVARNGLRVGDIKSPDFKEKYEKLKAAHLKEIRSLGFTIKGHRIDNLFFKTYEMAWFDAIDALKKLNLVNGEYWLNDCIASGAKVLAEGAQGTMLDVDFGTYPFVTSSNTICAGVCTGLGIPPTSIRRVFGITKAYCTRVGEGPFPTELFDETGKKLQDIGHEFGATTGRPRRCGWLDLVQLRYSCMINGVTDLIITKADVMNSFSEIQVCKGYDIMGSETNKMPFDITQVTPVYETLKWAPVQNGVKIPKNVHEFMNLISNFCNVKILAMSTGPDRKDMVPLHIKW